MATSEYDVRVTWENDNFFKMEMRRNADPWVTIISLEENTRLSALVGHIQALCFTAFNEEIAAIMKEMEV